MGAAIVDVASGLVTELNSDPLTNFGVNFTAVRSYADWDMKLEDNERLHCDVVPREYVEYGIKSRGTPTAAIIERVVSVRVGLRKRMSVDYATNINTPAAVLSEMDELVLALEQMADYTVQLALTDVANATWEVTSILVPYVLDHLRNNQQYTGIFEVIYRLDTAP